MEDLYDCKIFNIPVQTVLSQTTQHWKTPCTQWGLRKKIIPPSKIKWGRQIPRLFETKDLNRVARKIVWKNCLEEYEHND